jgi:hypothetical protein
MRIRTDFRQYEQPWWSWHCGKASASNASKIITPAKGDYSKSAIEYAYELVAQPFDPEYGIVSDFASAAMRNGTILEPVVRKFYEFERDCDVTEVGGVETDDERFIASPDGLCGEEGGLELKSPTHKTQVRYLNEGKLPDEYRPQVHMCLFITQRPWWDFMSFVHGMPPLLVRVEPDDYTRKLGVALEKFYDTFTEIRSKIQAARGEVIAEAVRQDGGVLEPAYF